MADSFDIDDVAAERAVPDRTESSGVDLTKTDPTDSDASDPAADPSAADQSAATDQSAVTQAGDAADAPPTGGARHGLSRRRGSKKPRRKAPWWELPALIALAIVIAVLVKTFLVQPFYIPSQSMEKTLHGCPGCSGDRILVSKVVYDFRDPHPGDIVVFHAPPGWNEEPASSPPSNPVMRAVRGFGQLIGFVPPDGMVLVKRVIAVGGQSVKGVIRHGSDEVFVKDAGSSTWRKLDETFVYQNGPDPAGKFGPFTVPNGRLWVMGDHRNESADSRYHCGINSSIGNLSHCDMHKATVPIGDVIGKAVVIAWPPSRWTTLGTPKTFTDTASALGANGLVPAFVVFPVFFVVRRRRNRR